MNYGAKAATNGAGNRLSVIDTISQVSMNATPVLNREPRKKEVKKGSLSGLIASGAYSILAVYIINKYDPSPRRYVKYGRDGGVKWIEMDGKTYWERKGSIYDRYKGVK